MADQSRKFYNNPMITKNSHKEAGIAHLLPLVVIGLVVTFAIYHFWDDILLFSYDYMPQFQGEVDAEAQITQ